jgi:Ca-activated chloride channel family protein
LKRPVVVAPPTTITLPKTATDAELSMILGSVLLMFSLILFVFNRRQTLAR